MNKVDVKGISAVVVAVTICIAFLAVVLAPAFNVIIPQTTLTVVITLFGTLAGGAGVQYVVQKTQADTMKAMGKE